MGIARNKAGGFGAVLIALLLGACSQSRPLAPPAPETFAATVICAEDCRTIAYRITLFPDHSYWYERRYLTTTGETRSEFREVGHYTEVRGTLTLIGTRDAPERWQRVTDAALRLQDASLPANGTAASTAVVRQAQVDRSFGPLRLRGVLVHDAAITTLAPCGTGTTHPVSGGPGYAELELEYSRAVPRPGAPLLVAVEARFVPAPDEGSAALVIESFERAAPGAACFP